MIMSIVKRTTHDCYDHYELKSFQKLYTCDGCKMKGFGDRYACNLCGHELHKDCRFPKLTISHEYFGCSTFTFLHEPFTRYDHRNNRREYSKCCDACGKDICGFSYHCEPDNLDLHPCCKNLEKMLLINEMDFNINRKVSSKCIWCKKREVSGWSYVSSSNNYHFHVHCLSEMVHEACMKNGEMGMERVEFQQLVKSRRNRGSGNSSVFQTIKLLLKVLLAALLGDPTLLISNVVVELVSRGFQ